MSITNPSNISCIFCSKYLLSGTSPRQASCGDRLCGVCFSERGGLVVECPECAEKIHLTEQECFRDKAVEAEAASAIVKCSHESCTWEGLTTNVQKHEGACSFAVVRCPNNGCKARLTRGDLEAHRQECIHESISCSKCGSIVTRSKLPSHYNMDCPSVVVECRNDCGTKLPRGKMEEHLTRECSRQPHSCAYSNCGYKGTSKQVQQHESENVTHHLRCLQQSIDEAHKTTLLARSAPNPTTEQKLQAEREKALNKLVADLTVKFQTLKADVSRMEATVDSMQEAHSEMSLTVQTIQATTFDGKFVWKVPEVSRRRQEARTGKTVSLYSAPFYTSRHGYKLCLRLYMNGDGSGKGTHLSFFITIMRGEYDALLPWPFKQAVTLSLVDQNKQRDIVQSFRPESSSTSFQRPRNEMNIASGCPSFASISVLDNTSYVKDDTMFLRCKIDQLGIETLY